LVGNNGDLDLPLLHVEHSIRSVALREDDLILAIFGYGSALADFGEKGFGIEWWSSFRRDSRPPGLQRRTSCDSKHRGVPLARQD
jgi:hypothetical protein